MDLFESVELAMMIVVVVGLLLSVFSSWWGSRPPKGRRVRDIVRRIGEEDDQA